MITQSLPLAFLLGDATPMELFIKGEWIMWPMILVSFVMITVVVERLIFIFRENSSRNDAAVKQILESVERGDADKAIALGKGSSDFVAQIIAESLKHREQSLSNAFTRAANQQLMRYQQGLATLDTCITAAPLLGLLGTVTGMMRTFGALGGGDIGAAAGTITGGVAEALIATAAGLAVAVLGLFPYNYLNTMDTQAKLRVSDASHALEVFTKKAEGSSARH